MAAPAPAPSLATDPCADRAARRAAVLEALTGIGMDLAQELRRQVLAGEAAGDPALAFSRIARTVRQTVALGARLDEPLQAQAERTRAEAAARAAGAEAERIDARLRGLIRKETVKDIVERTIEAEAVERGEGFAAERLFDDLDDLDERLEAGDLADFEALPVVELVARVCRDLGVPFRPELLSEEDWVEEDWAEEAFPAGRGEAHAARRRLDRAEGPPDAGDRLPPPSPWNGEGPPARSAGPP